MNDYIYCLYEIATGTKFYIGRTIDPARRLREHRIGSKNYKKGDEDKYQYANALDSMGIEWNMEILMECGPDTEFYEDFFVNLYRHEPLQNMRAGDSEPWMGRDYRNPEELLAAKKQCLEEIKNKEKRVKKHVDADPERMIFSFEDPHKKFMSPAYRKLAEKRRF